MVEKTDPEILLRLYEEERTHARFHENHRVSGSNFLAVVAAALIGLVTYDQQINASDLFASMLILLTGLYGVVFMLKAGERKRLHFNRGYGFLSRLVDEEATFNPREVMLQADQKTKASHPLLYRLPLASMWVVYHSVVSAIAIFLIATIFVPPLNDRFGSSIVDPPVTSARDTAKDESQN